MVDDDVYEPARTNDGERGLYVTDFKGNDPLFAFYFLKALDFDRFNSGSAQPSLNRNFIYPFPIRVSNPTGQKAIAAVLGALDDKIELNRRMNATLEAMARALFQSWFEDFDHVRSKLDGRPSAALEQQVHRHAELGAALEAQPAHPAHLAARPSRFAPLRLLD